MADFVPPEDIEAEWERCAGELGFTSEVSNVLEWTLEEYLECQRQGGDSMLQLAVGGSRARGAPERGYPELWEFTEGHHTSIEAETSTITKPMQTLTNLRKAMENNRLCVRCEGRNGEI